MKKKSTKQTLHVARLVCRDDGNTGLIIGKNFGGLFKPNTVYEVIEILGEYIIKECGPTAIGTNKFTDHLGRTNWAHTANDIIEDGSHLYTKEEYKKVCERDNKI